MHNLRRRRDTNINDVSSNVSLLESAASYDMYSYWFGPKDMEANTSATFSKLPVWTAPSATMPSRWVFLATEDECITVYVRRHLEWRNGMLYVIPHMSHSTNTNNVVIGLDINTSQANAAMPAIAATKTKTLAVPGTANSLHILGESTYLSGSGWVTKAVTEADSGVYIHFYRLGTNGSDDCAGTTSLWGLELRYMEGTRGFGQKWDPLRRNV